MFRWAAFFCSGGMELGDKNQTIVKIEKEKEC